MTRIFRYPKLSQLGLEWYALPAVSCMSLNVCSGVVFHATAFSGWYSLTEVAVRNMLDEQRYALTSKLCTALDIGNNISNTFAKDRVAMEMCDVVLYSYNAQGVSIVDHHTQSQQVVI